MSQIGDRPRSLECDVLVIGSRVAGSVLAAILGAAGHRVVLVDRARFPSSTVSTHFFRGQDGVAALRQIGVLDDVLALGAPKLCCQYDYVDGDSTPEVHPPQSPGDVGFCLSVRRKPLDEILVRRAAREPTVRLLEGTRFVDVARDDGRVRGAVLEADGETLKVRAEFTVGADGRHSAFAKAVNAELEFSDRPARALFYQYVRDFPRPGLEPGAEFSLRDDELAYVFPSDDGVTCVAASVNLRCFADIRGSLAASFPRVISRHPGVDERFRAATPISRVLGCGPERHYVRRPVGDGWALVGDASIHQDPWTGKGIDFASRHAILLAQALMDALGGPDKARTIDTYWRQRNQHGLETYHATNKLAKDLRQLSSE